MRQLKGGKQKETRKQKQERRVENQKIQQQFKSIVLPTVGVVFIFIILYVYLKSRPRMEM